MRYRHLRYRYTVYAAGASGLLGESLWRPTRVSLFLAQPHWRPDTDVRETATAIEVMVDVAGVAEDDMEVQVFEDALVVDGQRRLPACEEDAVYHAAAIRQGPFRVAVPIPATVDADGVQARYADGLLRITLPKRRGEDAAS